jgi:hypothetical protein
MCGTVEQWPFVIVGLALSTFVALWATTTY